MTEGIAVQGPASLAHVPEHLRASIGQRDGKENVGRDDLLIPRLCIAQQLSPQLDKTNESFIRGLEAGQMFNSVTSENYGEEVLFIPLFFFKQYIHFHPIEEGGGIVAQYQKESEVPRELLEWKDGKPPIVTEFKNRMGMVNGQLICLSFKSTGMKFAKKLNSFIAMLDMPAYARNYRIRSVQQTKGQQKWWGMSPSPAEYTDPVFFEKAQRFFRELQDEGYKVDVSGIEPEGREPGSDEGEQAPY